MRILWVGPESQVPRMGIFRPGEVYEVSDEVAKEWIALGKAELAEKKPEKKTYPGTAATKVVVQDKTEEDD